jgi:hypothetical protein
MFLSDSNRCTARKDLRDQGADFALHRKFEAIGRLDQVDLHGDMRHITAPGGSLNLNSKSYSIVQCAPKSMTGTRTYCI